MNDLRQSVPDSLLFGKSAGMRLVQQKVQRLSNINISVLIQGESGTGKEVMAFAIHLRTFGQDRPFLKITCPSVPAYFLEGEHRGPEESEPWSGNGASPNGHALAKGGTLFIDGISELDEGLQAKFLQSLPVEAFGPSMNGETPRANVRVICATNRDLEAEVESGQFREDLFYRINAFNICLPPLRQRVEDIPALVEHFLMFHSEKSHAPVRPLSRQLLQLMERYHWPGNIRELENVIRRYVILGSEQVIGSELLARVRSDVTAEPVAGGNISLKQLSRQVAHDVERRLILQALETSGWNRKAAARSLNISYRALLYKIKQGGFPPKRAVTPRASAASLSDE